MSLAISSNPFSKRSSCGAPSFPAMSEHPWTGPARTAERGAQGGWDARSAGSGAGKHTEPVPAARGTAMAHRGRNPAKARMATSTITRAHSKGHQFVTETTRTENQGKDHPMQNAGPTIRQEDPTQASPARSAIAHRTLSTPHAHATSCPMSTCRHARR